MQVKHNRWAVMGVLAVFWVLVHVEFVFVEDSHQRPNEMLETALFFLQVYWPIVCRSRAGHRNECAESTRCIDVLLCSIPFELEMDTGVH